MLKKRLAVLGLIFCASFFVLSKVHASPSTASLPIASSMRPGFCEVALTSSFMRARSAGSTTEADISLGGDTISLTCGALPKYLGVGVAVTSGEGIVGYTNDRLQATVLEQDVGVAFSLLAFFSLPKGASLSSELAFGATWASATEFRNVEVSFQQARFDLLGFAKEHLALSGTIGTVSLRSQLAYPTGYDGLVFLTTFGAEVVTIQMDLTLDEFGQNFLSRFADEEDLEIEVKRTAMAMVGLGFKWCEEGSKYCFSIHTEGLMLAEDSVWRGDASMSVGF